MSVTGNLAKKRTEGKHDNIVLFHAAKKLILSIVSALLYSFCAICFDHFHSFSGLTFNSQSFFLYCYFDYVYWSGTQQKRPSAPAKSLFLIAYLL